MHTLHVLKCCGQGPKSSLRGISKRARANVTWWCIRSPCSALQHSAVVRANGAAQVHIRMHKNLHSMDQTVQTSLSRSMLQSPWHGGGSAHFRYACVHTITKAMLWSALMVNELDHNKQQSGKFSRKKSIICALTVMLGDETKEHIWCKATSVKFLKVGAPHTSANVMQSMWYNWRRLFSWRDFYLKLWGLWVSAGYTYQVDLCLTVHKHLASLEFDMLVDFGSVTRHARCKVCTPRGKLSVMIIMKLRNTYVKVWPLNSCVVERGKEVKPLESFSACTFWWATPIKPWRDHKAPLTNAASQVSKNFSSSVTWKQCSNFKKCCLMK